MAHSAEAEEAVNADSFLDIVASVVSVMIIMVMMTGLKIKNTPPDALPTSEVLRAGGDLVRKQQEEQTLRGDVEKIATEMEQVERQTAVRERERDILSLAVTGLDQQLRGARQTAAQQAAPDIRVAAKVDRCPQPAGDSQPPAGSDREISRAVGADRECHHTAGPHRRGPRGALSAQSWTNRLRAVERAGGEGR